MDVKTYIKQQMAKAHREIDAAMKDTTDEQFNWPAPDTINPINAILIHVLAGEDFFIQTILQGKSRCWETQGWGAKIGIPKPPERGSSWDEFKTIRIPAAPVLAYGQAIYTATDAYLDTLTPEELDRQVTFAGRVVPAAEVLEILVVHIASHAGEMATIKGMQGIKGLPF